MDYTLVLRSSSIGRTKPDLVASGVSFRNAGTFADVCRRAKRVAAIYSRATLAQSSNVSRHNPARNVIARWPRRRDFPRFLMSFDSPSSTRAILLNGDLTSSSPLGNLERVFLCDRRSIRSSFSPLSLLEQ